VNRLLFIVPHSSFIVSQGTCHVERNPDEQPPGGDPPTDHK
jgi:hypothetical protein